jgi:hypothetical protein
MNVRTALIANASPTKAMKPAERALYNPTPAAWPFARLDAIACKYVPRCRAGAARYDVPVMRKRGQRAVCPAVCELDLVTLALLEFRSSSVQAAESHGRGRPISGLSMASHAGPQEYDVCSPACHDQLGFDRCAHRPMAMARWLHRCSRDPTQSGRIHGAGAVPPRGYSAKRQPPSTHADGANSSFRSRSRVHAVGIPRECRS